MKIPALLLAVLVFSTQALAQRCEPRRLEYLKRHLAAEARRGDNWAHAWAVTYTGLTIVQLAASPAIVESDKIEWYVGAASSALGLSFVLLDPLEVIEAGPDFARRAGWAHGNDEVCALIAEGEGLMMRTAQQERAARGWLMHSLNVAANIGLALILGLGVGHWVAAAVNFAVGVAVGELTIFTAPSRLISAWSDYERGALDDAPPSVSVRVVPIIHPDGAGLGLALTF
jgi:hypothetical protein